MKKVLASSNVTLKNVGLFFIRVGLGAIFVRHGWPKLVNGPTEWVWLGSQMATLGITFLPTFWGLMAALTEFVGGICLVVGFATRFFSLLLSFTMLVAALMHYGNGDEWNTLSHPLSLCVVFFGLMIAGSGSFAVDNFFIRSSSTKGFDDYPM